MLKLFNTLSRKKENFQPSHGKKVGMYACGPTVYNYAHIGNLRAYVFEDILRRALEANGYTVKEVINITDVGHLTSDADEGEDKMEKGSKREGKTAWEIADFYTKAFRENLKDLNIQEPEIWAKATDHIKEQIAQVQILINKGYTYETSDGIYFDTTKLADYGKMAGLNKQKLKAGARVVMGEKKNPHDFALWKWSERSERTPELAERADGSEIKTKRQMEWDAFGRKGFPGWHIECTAMSMKYLGNQFDIHCGGIDHVPVHHTNEIAQAEGITGKKPWVKYWLHNEHLLMAENGEDAKMAKSGDNFITLDTLQDKGFSPLAYRYFLLQAHYRKQLSFSWEALGAAQNGLERLCKTIENWKPNRNYSDKWYGQFLKVINDDLNTPEGIALMQELLKSAESDGVKKATLIKFDEVLGLDLGRIAKKIKIPSEIQKLLEKRDNARKKKNWAESDRLRAEISKSGFDVEDTPEGQKIEKQ